MGDDAIVRSGRLQKRISRSEIAKKLEMEKLISTRNPLRDVNGLPIPPIQASNEDQRKGCFRFLRPSSSSNEDFMPRFKSQPRTPKSAPASKNLSSKTIADPCTVRTKTRKKSISVNPQNFRSMKQANPTAPDLLHRWNRIRPSSRAPPGAKITAPQTIFKLDLEGRNGYLETCTPDRTIVIEEVKPPDSKVKEDKQLSSTPLSNSTPPIQASISPEVLCGFSLSPIPVCFATGHVMAGVQDRRKCRPRGILRIGEEQSNVSQVWSVPPPCAEASVCWFSSPLEIANEGDSDKSSSKVQTPDFPKEASMNCLLSPNGAFEQVIESRSIMPTPSSCTDFLRTPTSGSSISPFSMIVQRAKASSGLRILTSHRENEGCQYGDPVDISPCAKSWSNSGAHSTPDFIQSTRNVAISPLELDSATADLEALRLSSTTVLGKVQNDLSPLNSLSFKFGCQPTVLNSVDLNSFKDSLSNEMSKAVSNTNVPVTDVRVSWREELLSRDFERGELDSYHSCFADDEYTDYLRNPIELTNGSSIFEKVNGFGSYEFSLDENKTGAQMCSLKFPTLQSDSIAESISTEGVLFSSGDSDWTQFYKNNLFEV